MPPKVKVTSEQIVEAALQIVRDSGFENLNARALAEKIGCSVHPIFRVYESMEGLKSEVYKEAEKLYNSKMIEAMNDADDGFQKMGLAYIEFAKNEKNLFKLLFMSDVFGGKSMLEIVGSTEGDDEVIAMLCMMTGLNAEHAKELYAGLWLTTHGIATMYATNNCRFSDAEILRLLGNSFMGTVMTLKEEETDNEK